MNEIFLINSLAAVGKTSPKVDSMNFIWNNLGGNK
jgi:hypothetical protein